MTYKSNLKHLKNLLEATPATKNKKKVVKVIQLYEERKIPNYRTALATVAKLTIPSLYKKGEADDPTTNYYQSTSTPSPLLEY